MQHPTARALERVRHRAKRQPGARPRRAHARGGWVDATARSLRARPARTGRAASARRGTYQARASPSPCLFTAGARRPAAASPRRHAGSPSFRRHVDRRVLGVDHREVEAALPSAWPWRARRSTARCRRGVWRDASHAEQIDGQCPWGSSRMGQGRRSRGARPDGGDGAPICPPVDGGHDSGPSASERAHEAKTMSATAARARYARPRGTDGVRVRRRLGHGRAFVRAFATRVAASRSSTARRAVADARRGARRRRAPTSVATCATSARCSRRSRRRRRPRAGARADRQRRPRRSPHARGRDDRLLGREPRGQPGPTSPRRQSRHGRPASIIHLG